MQKVADLVVTVDPLYYVEQLPEELSASSETIAKAVGQGWLVSDYEAESDELTLTMTFANGRAVYKFAGLSISGVAQYKLESWVSYI